MKKLSILATIFALAMACGAALPQSAPHSVVLTVASPDTSSAAPGTATILRAAGACPASGVPASGTTLTSTLAVPATANYTDSTVIGGNTYAYWAVVKAQGGGSGVSNCFQANIAITVTVTGTVQ